MQQTMAGATSLEAVKRKIKFLQEQTDGAEERSERLQKELLEQKKAREQVSVFFFFLLIARQSRRELHYAKQPSRIFLLWPFLPNSVHRGTGG